MKIEHFFKYISAARVMAMCQACGPCGALSVCFSCVCVFGMLVNIIASPPVWRVWVSEGVKAERFNISAARVAVYRELYMIFKVV